MLSGMPNSGAWYEAEHKVSKMALSEIIIEHAHELWHFSENREKYCHMLAYAWGRERHRLRGKKWREWQCLLKPCSSLPKVNKWNVLIQHEERKSKSVVTKPICCKCGGAQENAELWWIMRPESSSKLNRNRSRSAYIKMAKKSNRANTNLGERKWRLNTVTAVSGWLGARNY